MTVNEKQIINVLNGLLNSPTRKYIKERFERLKTKMTTQKLTDITEAELFENLSEVSAVMFIKFQTQLKQINNN